MAKKRGAGWLRRVAHRALAQELRKAAKEHQRVLYQHPEPYRTPRAWAGWRPRPHNVQQVRWLFRKCHADASK